MLIARDYFGNEICARCGKTAKLTVDHFIPKSCRMTVNENGNYVGLCKECNQEKADKIILPSWYSYLPKEKQDVLNRYMRYAKSYIKNHCEDKKVLEHIEKL